MNKLLESALKLPSNKRNKHLNPSRDLVEVAVEYLKGNLNDKQVGEVLEIPYFNSRCACHTIIKEGIRLGFVELKMKP